MFYTIWSYRYLMVKVCYILYDPIDILEVAVCSILYDPIDI